MGIDRNFNLEGVGNPSKKMSIEIFMLEVVSIKISTHISQLITNLSIEVYVYYHKKYLDLNLMM